MRSFWISALASMAMAFAGPAASHAQGAVAPASEETQNFVRGFVRFLVYCPLSQYVVADVLGLSPEHLNRVMRQLRLTGLLCVRRGRVDLLNAEGLGRLADFDPAYLRSSRAA